MVFNPGVEELERLPSLEVKYDNIQHLVDKVNLSEISSIRHSISSIVRVINDPRSTVKELKETIQLDPPLAARVLRTANSAYYSRSGNRTFTEIEQAIIWMGSATIRELALNQKVCEIFDEEEGPENYSRKALWRHSIAVATLAKSIFRKEFGLRGENAYAAGLLHDIGIIAEAQFLPAEFNSIIQYSRANTTDIALAEQEILGYDHAEVGAAICKSWGLPDELVAAIGGHYNPGKSNVKFSRIASTIYISNYFCKENGFGFGFAHVKDPQMFRECLDIMEVKPHALDIIFKSVKKDLNKMKEKGLL
ncbi:MAG: HDOD domain-containing protein [bacterium]|nr:HDOD domain-containing protein [bacterium]